MKNHRNLFAAAALVAVTAMFAVGCGSSDDSSDSGSSTAETTTSESGTGTSEAKPTESIALAADPGGALAYVEKTLSAKPGELEVTFTNESPIAHNVAFDDGAGEQVALSDVITGSNTFVQFNAKSGKYTYYCTLPGHEAAGMKGTLTVK